MSNPELSAADNGSFEQATDALGSRAAREVVSGYERKESEYVAHAELHERHAGRLSLLRLLAFVGAFIALAWAATAEPGQRTIATATLIAAIIVFIALVVFHGRAARVGARAREAAREARLGVHRVRREWNALPPTPDFDVRADHPYALDLDVVGRASLIRLLQVVSGAPGMPMLRAWLLDVPVDAGETAERQEAVRELAAADELREALSIHARRIATLDASVVENFTTWAGSADSARPVSAGLMVMSYVLPAATLTLFALGGFGLVPQILAMVPAVLALVIVRGARDATGSALDAVAGYAGPLVTHRAMISAIRVAPLASARMKSLQSRLATGEGADHALERLTRTSSWAEVRHSPMVHFILQALLMWDVHVAGAVHRWRRGSGSRFRDWMAALGEAEALVALGTLLHDNPDWALPDVTALGVQLEARNLGHPLLPADARVGNDVSVGPAGSLLLITGSNMSGKSTLLRAVGLNTVLACVGGPVCASGMTLPPLRPWTSIRIHDSLEQGMSLFMAELHRLKQLVDAADFDHPAPQLYLLDEILHGTNTAERRIAARAVLERLVNAGAIGAVTTHDLSLAEEGEIAAAAVPVHFTESFVAHGDGTRMTFDYRLRPGLATSTNALALVRLMGLAQPAGA